MKNEKILMTGSYNHNKSFCRFNQCCRLMPGQRSSFEQHRCVTHLYVIPMGNFNCAMRFAKQVMLYKQLLDGEVFEH